MPYIYDAFFSYKRDLESDAWHAKVKAKLEFWVRQELQRQDVRIFFDTEEIHTGNRFKQKLASALKQSRCVVCVWSPLYFQSKYCYSEWSTFLHREKITQKELVLPASFHDGESFPANAKAIQYLDFSPFANTMPAFWDTAEAVRFQPLLQQFARDLANMIRDAPPYDDGFPIVDVPDEELSQEETIGRPANG